MPAPAASPIRLIAFDLDGTLLNSDKAISPVDLAALERAAARGIELVPATGRFAAALPDCVRALPCWRYLIACNGAQLCDRQTGQVLGRAEIPWQQAVEIMEYLDTLPVIYDCYLDNAAWISAAQQPQIPAYSPNAFVLDMWQRLRQPVPELKAFLRETGHGVQKISCLFRDMDLRETLLQSLQGRFAQTLVTSSIVNNLEFNHAQANKGAALQTLAAQLRIPREQTLAIGDDWNDIPMLQAAGIGVAMQSAPAPVRSCADAVTADSDHGGLAAALARFAETP